MDPAALTRSLTHIQANLDGDLSLAALAAVAGCSPLYWPRVPRAPASTAAPSALRRPG